MRDAIVVFGVDMGSLECARARGLRAGARKDRVFSTVRIPRLFCRLSVLFPKWKRRLRVRFAALWSPFKFVSDSSAVPGETAGLGNPYVAVRLQLNNPVFIYPTVITVCRFAGVQNGEASS